ncbi:ubiquitin-conjugating enzyme E2 variant 3 [Gadus morhua]|uniref:UEV and lactate/malate dehyrogenase domains n=1 Tax=Gadus morhua TaxID=8049 RepID=A0A8C4Z3K7_GADMO|nr:ubiquitin-conjugating enzyme E2 variant 3-like [Gadus morhua]
MDINSEKKQRILSRYKFHDVAIEELEKIHRVYPDMQLLNGTYTFTDGTQKDLLKLIGNLPVTYDGQSYNFPILLWLLDSFPFTPPICLLRPTPAMVIREGRHVDARGRIYLPMLHNWDHPKTNVVALLKEMSTKFQQEAPLSSKASGDEDPHKLLASISSLQKEGGVRHHDQPHHKVSVIGGGDLGMATVMSILAKGMVDKLVFIDVAESSTKGGSGDLEIFRLPKVEVSKDLSASAGSAVVVVTANAWSNEQSYEGVVQTNVDMYRGIIPALARHCPHAVMLIASHPVDIMTHVAWRQSGLPPTHVIGAGCNLDSERLCQALDINLNVHKQAWILGEQTGGKVAVMSNVGTSSSQASQRVQIAPSSSASKPLLERALDLTKNRGQRSWSVGLSLADITHTVLTGRHKVHSISTLAQGWGGVVSEVFLSLPCLLGANGSMRLAETTLGQEDRSALETSVTSLSDLMTKLRL